jgi:TolA-binding protein
MKSRASLNDYLKTAAERRPPNQALSCVDEEQITAFYSGQLDERKADAIRDHLVECRTCRELAREARQFLQAMTEPMQVATAAPMSVSTRPWYRVHGPRLWRLAAAVLLAVSLPLLVWQWQQRAPSDQQAKMPPTPSQPRENPWRNLEIAKADYVPAPPDELIWRDEPGTPTSPKVSALARAMRPYQQNDFAEAEQRLAQFLEKNPKHAQAHFYRGVSLLMLGRTTEAVAPLEAAVEYGQGRVSEEAHWYLAQAYLKADEPSKALEQLDTVIAAKGKYRADAEKLYERVRQEASGR